MWSSPLFWIAFSIALFWALGAYNRLMRLRSAVVQAFGSLDAHMVRLVALLGEFGAAARHVQPQGPSHPNSQQVAALQGATTQLSASLAVARARPLQADAIAALAAARDVLYAAWPGALWSPGAPQGAADAPGAAPAQAVALSSWQALWDEHVIQNDRAAQVYDDAVAQYNAAISQFPASVLAWVFGFKAALGLRANG